MQKAYLPCGKLFTEGTEHRSDLQNVADASHGEHNDLWPSVIPALNPRPQIVAVIETGDGLPP